MATLTMLVCAAFCVLCGCAGSNRAALDPAGATFRGDLAHTGVYTSGGAPQFGGVRWRVQTAGPVRSTPAAAAGRIYFGSADGRVYAVDMAGHTIWATDAGSPVTSSPAVSGGHVYAQTRAGEVVALTAQTGAVVWRAKTGAVAPLDWGYESGDVYVSSPAVFGETVVVGSGDSQLYALDARTGATRWRVETGGRVRSSPAIDAGTVYVGSMDGSLYAVELTTGKLRWKFDTRGHSLRSADFGFDRKTIQSSPAVADGAVYFGARDGFIYAVDAATGQERWHFDHEGSWIITSPAVWEGRVYAGSSDSKFVQALDARTGKELWRAKTEGVVWSSPAIANGMLYVGDGAGVLYAFDARTGERHWTYRCGAGVQSSPVPVDGALVVGSNDGAVYAIGSGAGGGPLRRVVFWDESLVRAAWYEGHKTLRNYLAARDYEVMDARALATFLDASLKDGSARRAVVTFAIDYVPPEIAGQPIRTGLLRRFLDAGGKVVWVGFPPLIWQRDPKTGDAGAYNKITRDASRELLDVDFAPSNFDRYGTTVTDAGRAWGLSGWWLAPWSVKTTQVSEVLATDETGMAAAWVKDFGGGAGTGFVMISRGTDAWSDPGVVETVGDYRPR